MKQDGGRILDLGRFSDSFLLTQHSRIMSYLIINEQTLETFRCNCLNDVLNRVKENTTPHPQLTFPKSSHDSIFHDALDMAKVKEGLYNILNLKDERGNGVFRFQKLWYVVYRVFVEMDWLHVKKATKFREWANEVFGEKGRCTKQDFDKVISRFKNKPTKEWKAYADNEMPYVEVARVMWHTLQGTEGKAEAHFLKRNGYIYHPNMPR